MSPELSFTHVECVAPMPLVSSLSFANAPQQHTKGVALAPLSRHAGQYETSRRPRLPWQPSSSCMRPRATLERTAFQMMDNLCDNEVLPDGVRASKAKRYRIQPLVSVTGDWIALHQYPKQNAVLQ